MSTNIVVCSDMHYINRADHTCRIPERRAELGLRLLQRALLVARDEIGADAVVVLGDLVDKGGAPGAQDDMREIHDVLEESGLTCYAVPGNHDGDIDAFLKIFQTNPGIHRIGDVSCFIFVDEYGADDVAVRDPASMQAMADAFKDVEGPRIVFQHSPVQPKIEHSYPYNIRDHVSIGEKYDQCGVTLCVSGHYHTGMPITPVNHVRYLINPALCETPFQFTHIRVTGDEVSADVRTVTLDG